MSDFLTRLEEEQRELQIKIDALESFINNNDNFAKIGVKQNIVLKNQLSVMRSHNENLIIRLGLLKKSINSDILL